MAAPRLRRLGPLRGRDFRLLFSGQLVSLAGSAMAPIALAFAVLDIGSPSDLGLVLASAWVPQIVFILVGGVWADRLPRNRVMIAANVLSGVAQAIAATLLLTHHAAIWALMATQALRGIAISFFFPASQGVVPQVVAADHIQSANALLRMSQNATNIGGAALGGALVAAISPGWAIAFDAVTYFASAVLLARIRTLLTRREGAPSFVRELAEGWNEFRSRTWLWLIVVAAGFGNAAWIGAQSVLGPVVAKSSLGGAAGWGVLASVTSVGFVCGGLLTLRWKPRRILAAGVLSLLPTSVYLVLLARPAPYVAVAVGAFAVGIGSEVFGVYWITALQQHVPDAVLARVNSYDALGSFVLIPIGLSVAGPLADAFGVERTLYAAACVALATTVAMLSARDVWRVERID